MVYMKDEKFISWLHLHECDQQAKILKIPIAETVKRDNLGPFCFDHKI